MLGKLQEQKIKRMFKFYDLDGDGVIRKNDFEKLSVNFASIRGWSPESNEQFPLHAMFLSQWDDLQKLADKNQDNKVTIDEWLQYWQNILTSEEAYDIIVDGFGNAFFQLVDRDNDKKISYKEYQEFVTASEVDDFNTKDAFDKLTHDSGILTFEEAKQIRVEFFLKNDKEAAGNWLFGPIS